MKNNIKIAINKKIFDDIKLYAIGFIKKLHESLVKKMKLGHGYKEDKCISLKTKDNIKIEIKIKRNKIIIFRVTALNKEYGFIEVRIDKNYVIMIEEYNYEYISLLRNKLISEMELLLPYFIYEMLFKDNKIDDDDDCFIPFTMNC